MKHNLLIIVNPNAGKGNVPNKIHKNAMPRLGGLAVIAGFAVSTIYLLIVMCLEGTLNLKGLDKLMYTQRLVHSKCVIKVGCVALTVEKTQLLYLCH